MVTDGMPTSFGYLLLLLFFLIANALVYALIAGAFIWLEDKIRYGGYMVLVPVCAYWIWVSRL